MTPKAGAGPLVSVVMPVRDGAATVERAVESIRAQTFADWELVAVDDGSEDGTPGRLKALAAADPRIVLVERQARGIVPALNDGLAIASGELIARMDADDESHPERLAEQVALLAARPELGVAACRVTFGGEASAGGFARHVAWQNSLVEEAEIARERFVESPLAHPSVLFRKELVERHGAYRQGPFPEDYELWLRWMDAGVRMAKVPRALFTWNDPPGRLSRTDPRCDAEAHFRLKAEWLARWLARHVGHERAIHIWGAGRPTRRRARMLEAHGVRLAGWVDVDPAKIGKTYGGLACTGANGLPPPERAFVLGYVSKWGAHETIRSALPPRGFVEGRDFLLAA